MHFNSFYINTQQLCSWVLDVRGNKELFRRTASRRTAKIDGERRSMPAIPPFTPFKTHVCHITYHTTYVCLILREQGGLGA